MSFSRLLLAICMLHHSYGLAAAADRSPLPNVVVILADDLGYGDLSCYGAKDIRTPNIDEIAAGGVRFDQFYANCTVCSPTRASLLTGRYPELVGVPGVIRTHAANNWGFLDPSARLLPELLDSAGYHTALVGKWHLGLESPNLPTERGFHHVHGFLGDMMDDYETHLRHDINYMRLGDKVIEPKGHATDLFTAWACDYIRSRDMKRPFFLYLAYNAPHSPVQPTAEWLQKVSHREKGISSQRAKLAAFIEHMDHGVGQVVKALRETGAYENTLLVFSSDNGGDLPQAASNGALRDGKGSMYEGGIRVPFCAVWPGKIEAGGRTDEPAMTMDLFATVAAIVNAPHDDSIDGRSLLPLLRGEAKSLPDRDLFWTRREGGPRFMGKTIHAMRRGPYKLVQNSPFGPLELYDLSKDLLEQRDLAQAQPGQLQKMAAALQAHIQRSGSVPWQQATEAGQGLHE